MNNIFVKTYLSKKHSKGFTLIETLIAIFIFSLIFGGLAMSISHLYRVYDFVWAQASAVSEARRGVKTMIREIRGANTGDDGSYAIQKAENNEFIFFSDINKDGKRERVRYFLGGASANEATKECVTYLDGGSCSVNFSNFYQGTLQQAQVQVSVEGDFGWYKEFADIYADGVKLGDLCHQSGSCSDCPGAWQGTATFDVTQQAQDNNLQLLAEASSKVNNFCDWQESNHSMKVKFKLSWVAVSSGKEKEFDKGVIEPVGQPVTYPLEQEKITIISRYVQNSEDSPSKNVFKYFDENGQEITETPARPEQTKLMRVSLIVNVNPLRKPDDYLLQSEVQLRNLKSEKD